MGAHLLLVDDSADYRRSLLPLLQLEGHRIEEASSVEEARRKLQDAPIQLAVVDLRLSDDEDPYDITGLDVARSATERRIPCILITAYPSVDVARLALRSRGAEPLAVEMVPKASGPQALLDAIDIVLSRREAACDQPSGDLVIDLQRGLVWKKGVPLSLSRQQYSLLSYLCQSAGAVCSPEELVKAVYGEVVTAAQASADSRLEKLIARLREKIEDDASNPSHLLNVPGRGFRLEI